MSHVGRDFSQEYRGISEQQTVISEQEGGGVLW